MMFADEVAEGTEGLRLGDRKACVVHFAIRRGNRKDKHAEQPLRGAGDALPASLAALAICCLQFEDVTAIWLGGWDMRSYTVGCESRIRELR